MILIVGCGFLGSYLTKHISSLTDESIIVTVRSANSNTISERVKHIKCDITNSSDLAKLAKWCENEPLTIFYFAACHNVDYVYENPDIAKSVNIAALENFLEIIPNIRKLFFSSTDCVYGEGNNSIKFTENSLLNPVNEYGRQKLAAEKIVISKGYTVLRLPFMLGPSLTSNPHFYDTICTKLLNGDRIEMIDGMKRSVLSYKQAAELIYSLSVLPVSLPQIINVCSDTELSKYEIGCVLAEKLKVSLNLVERISEEDAQKFFKDKRASIASMDNTLLKSLLGVEKIHWSEINISKK